MNRDLPCIQIPEIVTSCSVEGETQFPISILQFEEEDNDLLFQTSSNN